jgi:flagellar biosynthetic protein FliP
MTSFTRLVIVLSLLRQALGVQQVPPNQVLIGIALFLTIFVMRPTFMEINKAAIVPYNEGEITEAGALSRATGPLRDFMLRNIRGRDLNLFMRISGTEADTRKEAVPLFAVIPAFITSELKTAFQIGFLIYLPFLVIDMVVAGILMSMGMMMLPPVMISLPFKLILFVLVDGWYLLVGSLVKSFS